MAADAHRPADAPSSIRPAGAVLPKRQTLSPEAVYAARCNENYTDVKAALENGRSYVRAAALKAQVITIYRCIAKPPVIILSGFAVNEIKDAATRCGCG
jgi:hypothetical protein